METMYGAHENNENGTGEDNYSSSGSSFLLPNFGLFVGTLVVCIFVLTAFSFCLRGFCYDRCGGRECCRGALATRERREIRQRLAEAAQQEIQRSNRNNRNKRGLWIKAQYRRYLQPYTVSLREENLVGPNTNNNGSAADRIPCEQHFNVLDLEEGRGSAAVGVPSLVAVQNLDGEDCIFCLKEYQVGDVVVVSPTRSLLSSPSPSPSDNTKCPHVFHLDCMLEWLAIGKELCPVCRGRFVPPHAIQNNDNGGYRSNRRQEAPTVEEYESEGSGVVEEPLASRDRGPTSSDVPVAEAGLVHGEERETGA